MLVVIPLIIIFASVILTYSSKFLSQWSVSTLLKLEIADLMKRNLVFNGNNSSSLLITKTIVLSKILDDFFITSNWPLFIGSKCPGNIASLILIPSF